MHAGVTVTRRRRACCCTAGLVAVQLERISTQPNNSTHKTRRGLAGKGQTHVLTPDVYLFKSIAGLSQQYLLNKDRYLGTKVAADQIKL
jgi:hypothetical protein